MITKREIPILLLMLFTLIYSTIGDPDSVMWSGWYFIVNYTILLFLFTGHRSKTVRLSGIALSISIIIFIVLKFFLNLNVERIYTFVTFFICIICLISWEYASSKRKNL